MTDDMTRRRIVANRDMLTARLRLLEISAARQAETLARSAPGLPATFGRHASDWTRAHEREYQAHLAKIHGDQRNDRGALKAKIDRQNAALRAMNLRDAANARRQNSATPALKAPDP